METSPPRFIPLEDPRRRGGALGITVGFRAASSDGDGSWPELGFRCACREERERDVKWGS
jgi:hypothetical protein